MILWFTKPRGKLDGEIGVNSRRIGRNNNNNNCDDQ